MWLENRGRGDRILSAVEITALGIWSGAQIGFAFIFAPIAFRVLGDPLRFNAVVTPIFGAMSVLGYVCGGIAVLTALARSRDAGDRTADIVRAGLVVIALGLLSYHAHAIVPAITSIQDVTSPAFHALHDRSRVFYGGVLLLALAALVMVALRRPNR
jgi:hypothetical protein